MAKKEKLNKVLLFRYVFVQTLIVIFFFPFLLLPRKFHFGILYPILIKLFLWSGKINAINLNKDKIYDKYPVIYASNHKCLADGIIISKFLKGPYTYVMSYHIQRNIFFKIICKKMGLLAMDTRSVDLLNKSLIRIKKMLTKKLFSIIYFPEGKFVTDRPVGEFRHGITKLAKETEVEVVPIAIFGINNDFIFDKKSWWKDVYIKTGQPIKYSNFNDDLLFLNTLSEKIENLYLEIEEEVTFHKNA